jgi:SAM-dependent methyltransferase
MKEPTIVSPPIEMKTLVCGAGMEESFEEVGRGAVVFMKSLGMISPGVRFLDVGCGCGRVARFLLDEPLAEYVGFDRNSNMIDWCNEYLAPADSRFTFESFRSGRLTRTWMVSGEMSRPRSSPFRTTMVDLTASC